MPRYLVRKIYKYSEEVEVEAADESAAKDAAQQMEGERIHDDYLYDCEIIWKLKEEGT